jgi:hypothetical protein
MIKFMKKIFLMLCLLGLTSVSAIAADVIPDTVSLGNTNTFGVYQVGHAIVLYNAPDENSEIKQKIVWDSENVIPQNLKNKDGSRRKRRKIRFRRKKF